MNLHNLKPRPGAKHRVKRLGCGESSGLGKTSGRGHKGQKSRSGGGVRPGFEGGQMPLHRRLPKRGFNNARFQDKIAVVNVASLNERFEDGDTVNTETLKAARLVKGTYDGIKILGNGDLAKKLTVEGCKVSATAREKIEKAGGSVAEAQEPSK
jgi:large subunit ribosomal protein L15